MTEDEKPCLHCYLWDALNQYCQDAGEVYHDGNPIYDEIEILRAICSFASEHIAVNPDPKMRRNRIEAMTAGLTSQVDERVATGRHPKLKRLVHQ